MDLASWVLIIVVVGLILYLLAWYLKLANLKKFIWDLNRSFSDLQDWPPAEDELEVSKEEAKTLEKLEQNNGVDFDKKTDKKDEFLYIGYVVRFWTATTNPIIMTLGMNPQIR